MVVVMILNDMCCVSIMSGHERDVLHIMTGYDHDCDVLLGQSGQKGELEKLYGPVDSPTKKKGETGWRGAQRCELLCSHIYIQMYTAHLYAHWVGNTNEEKFPDVCASVLTGCACHNLYFFYMCCLFVAPHVVISA